MKKLSPEPRIPLYVVSALVLNLLFTLWLLNSASNITVAASVCVVFVISTIIAVRLYQHEKRDRDYSLSESIIDGIAGFVVLDRDLRVMQVNQQFSKITGYAFAQIEARSILDLCFMRNRTLIPTIQNALEHNYRWKGEVSGMNRLGAPFTVNVIVERLSQIVPHKEKYVVTFTDITQRKDLERRLRTLVETDSLTECWNRRRFDRELDHYVNLANRYTNTQTCLAIIDIDHFKRINDEFGHDQGDLTLKEVAKVLRSRCRATDIISRVGGEEFAVLMPETTLNEAGEAMHRLKEAIKQSSTLGITISCGVSVVHTQADRTYRKADKALYRAKQSGRNRVCISETTLGERKNRRSPVQSIECSPLKTVAVNHSRAS